MKIGKLKEKILYSRLKSKDKEAFVKAYDVYMEQIYRFVYFKVGQKEDAQDLTSIIFLKTWNYIQNSSVTDHKTIKSLVYKIARNCIIDFYRERSGKNDLSIDIIDEDGNRIDIADETKDVMKQVELSFDFSQLEKKLSELKDEYREIIILRFIEELSISEIAEILDKSKGNIRIMTYRALKALRELLESHNS